MQKKSLRLDYKATDLAILCHKVDMGNIYSSDLTCSDKPLNIRDGIKVLFLINNTFILLKEE